MASFSNDQVLELARYVEQCSPDTIMQLASMFADHPTGMAGLGAGVVMLAVKAWRRHESGGE